eukprot:scaffold11187_cov30-Tisochrysis_lutea.AAC.5
MVGVRFNRARIARLTRPDDVSDAAATLPLLAEVAGGSRYEQPKPIIDMLDRRVTRICLPQRVHALASCGESIKDLANIARVDSVLDYLMQLAISGQDGEKLFEGARILRDGCLEQEEQCPPPFHASVCARGPFNHCLIDAVRLRIL